jgi:adenosylcobinamide kinase/adenosylcobinamide-phosphate guanylyltransferase
MGLVPETALGRLFRDLLGWANQALAVQADASYLMVARLPLPILPLATTIEQAAL